MFPVPEVGPPTDPVGIFFLVLLFWVPAAWVYIDAEQRGHSAYLWGGLTLLSSVLALIFYYRRRSQVGDPPELNYGRGRVYIHVALLTFYGIIFVSTLILASALIDYIRGEDPLSESLLGRDTELRRAVALVVALSVIALPMLAVHYEMMRRRIAPLAMVERGRFARIERANVNLVRVFSALTSLLAATMLVFEVTGRLFDVGGIGRDASTFGLSALIAGLLSLAAMYAYVRTPEYRRGSGGIA